MGSQELKIDIKSEFTRKLGNSVCGNSKGRHILF
jgi:hypothetical protein